MKRNALVALFMLFVLSVLLALTSSAQGPGTFNGTTYHISKSGAVAIAPVSGTGFNLTLPAKSNITLLDSGGDAVPIEVTEKFWRGSYRYEIVSNRSVDGYLNYTYPVQDQRFAVLARSGPVKMVLPPGYATGDPLLGRARPAPDEIREEDGQIVLVWDDPGQRVLEVSYYREGSPRAFRLFLLLLAFLGGLLALEHSLSMKRLRSMREKSDREK